MTAVPDGYLVNPSNTDADLVSGSIAGDQTAFAQIYDRYADRLYDFCVGMLRDRDGAADCVQDTFCIAATRLRQLREADRLRPWLYSIARNEALRRLRELRRETPTDELPDVESDDAGPDTLAARTELANLIAEAAGGLSDRDRAVFDLAYRHGLNGPDLADSLGVSHANANTIVKRLRDTIERSLGALLVARRARSRAGDCSELDEMLANWDGQFTVLMRKRISRHIESCADCDDERRRMVSPAALLGGAPVFMPAPKGLRDRTLGEVQLPAEDSAVESTSGDGRRRSRKWMLSAALLIAVTGASAGLTLAWLNKEPAAITPAEVSEVAPGPTGQTPRSASPAKPPIAVQPPPQVPNSTPRSAPPSVSDDPPVFAPTTVVGPPPSAAPPEPAPPTTKPAPSTKPPMSFSPTVVAPRPASPSPGGNGGNGGGSAPPGGGPVPG